MPQYARGGFACRNTRPEYADLVAVAVARVANHTPETPERIRNADKAELTRVTQLHHAYLRNRIRNKR